MGGMSGSCRGHGRRLGPNTLSGGDATLAGHRDRLASGRHRSLGPCLINECTLAEHTSTAVDGAYRHSVTSRTPCHQNHAARSLPSCSSPILRASGTACARCAAPSPARAIHPRRSSRPRRRSKWSEARRRNLRPPASRSSERLVESTQRLALQIRDITTQNSCCS